MVITIMRHNKILHSIATLYVKQSNYWKAIEIEAIVMLLQIKIFNLNVKLKKIKVLKLNV